MSEDKLLVDAHSLWDEGREKEAFRLFMDAAKLKISASYNNVGYMLDHGIGVDKDAEKAFFWYKKAARSGDKIAYPNVGLCYISIANIKLGKKWLIKAIKNGYHSAGIDLANVLIKENNKKAANKYLEIIVCSDFATEDEKEMANEMIKQLRTRAI
jgi:TPR repeat protein